jgi:hypothetical protein
MENYLMTEPHTRTEPHPRSRLGSPFAAELDRRLAGDEPLPDIVLWWWKEYQAWRKLQPLDAEGWGPSVLDLTDNEDSVYCLTGIWLMSKSKTLTEDDADPEV